MNIKFELPPDTFIVTKHVLKNVIREMMSDIQSEQAHDDVLTIQSAAIYLKISVPYLRELIRTKEIPHFQKGKVIRLCRTDLLEWVSEQKEEATILDFKSLSR
jgi:excisionase family DNA binding protein